LQTASLFVAYMPACDEVSGLVQRGEFPGAKHAAALEACITRCSQVHQVQCAALVEFAQSRLPKEESAS
jgi:ribonuclease PH